MEQPHGAVRTALSGLMLVAKMVAVIVVTHLMVERALADLFPELSSLQELLVATLLLTGLGGSLLWVLVVRPLQRMVEAERQATAVREAQLRTEGQRQDFDARLHRALEMADTEDASYTIVRRTLQLALPEQPTELLLADSSDAHLKRTVEAGPDGSGPGCGVESPHACPAIRRGQTLVFAAVRSWTPVRSCRTGRMGRARPPACRSTSPAAPSACSMPLGQPASRPGLRRSSAWKPWPARAAPASGCYG